MWQKDLAKYFHLLWQKTYPYIFRPPLAQRLSEIFLTWLHTKCLTVSILIMEWRRGHYSSILTINSFVYPTGCGHYSPNLIHM